MLREIFMLINQLQLLHSGIFQCVCLQCFDAIGWAGKGIRPVKTER